MARKKVESESEGAAGQELLGLEQAAGVLGVSRSTLTRWLSEGRLRGMKVGRQWRFKRADLDKFGQMAHPSAAAVNVGELDAVTASLPGGALQEGEITTEPALPNYPTAEEEVAVDRLFLALLANGVAARASDVHIEAAQEGCLIRTRIDGVLHETARLPRSAHKALAACVKYHADLAVDQTAVNQDGLFRLRVKDQTFHVRVATLPAVFGESIVMRILQQYSEVPDLVRIGMRQEDRDRFIHAVRYPVGLVIVSGPTGSGKTTVMYSGLQQVAKSELKTFSIEDPVEVVLPWITQVPVNRKAGLTFENAIRAVMRQDPDVIMVGDLRSQEAAEGCLQAAITGHLVLSTLHASSAALAVGRLLDMGLESFMVTEALLCIVACRLARKVCPHCAEPEEVPFGLLSPFAEMARVGGYTLPDNPKFMKGNGCEQCRNTGYQGRTGLYEVMELDWDLSRLILARAPSGELQQAAVKKGMTTLAADGLRKAAEGITTVWEAARVTRAVE